MNNKAFDISVVCLFTSAPLVQGVRGAGVHVQFHRVIRPRFYLPFGRFVFEMRVRPVLPVLRKHHYVVEITGGEGVMCCSRGLCVCTTRFRVSVVPLVTTIRHHFGR